VHAHRPARGGLGACRRDRLLLPHASGARAIGGGPRAVSGRAESKGPSGATARCDS
jgi:hypothetical protein